MPEILDFLHQGSPFYTNLLETYTIKMYKLHLSFLSENERKRVLIVEQMEKGFKRRGVKDRGEQRREAKKGEASV